MTATGPVLIVAMQSRIARSARDLVHSRAAEQAGGPPGSPRGFPGLPGEPRKPLSWEWQPSDLGRKTAAPLRRSSSRTVQQPSWAELAGGIERGIVSVGPSEPR